MYEEVMLSVLGATKARRLAEQGMGKQGQQNSSRSLESGMPKVRENEEFFIFSGNVLLTQQNGHFDHFLNEAVVLILEDDPERSED